MDDPFFMRGFQRVGDLPRERERLVHGERAVGQPLGQRWSFDELEHEAADTVGFFQPVDRCDVGVVQRRQYLRLPLEAPQAFGNRLETVGDDLDGDVAAQPGVAGAVHLAHSAGAEQRQDPVRAELAADQRLARICHDPRRQFPDRSRQEALRLVRVREERLHFPAQRLVIAARGRHERRAVAILAIERGVAEVFDPALPLGVDHRSFPSSSRNSSSFASRQSRLTVSAET